MNFLKPEQIIEVKYKCKPSDLDQVKNDLQAILNKVTPSDIAKLRKLAEDENKLAMARNFV